MSWAEKHFDLVAKQEGWEVLSQGWPDRVIVKEGQAIFVEVKRKGDPLRENQLKMFAFLRLLGLTVLIAVNGELSNLLTVEEFQQLPKCRRGEEDVQKEAELVEKVDAARRERLQ